MPPLAEMKEAVKLVTLILAGMLDANAEVTAKLLDNA